MILKEGKGTLHSRIKSLEKVGVKTLKKELSNWKKENIKRAIEKINTNFVGNPKKFFKKAVPFSSQSVQMKRIKIIKDSKETVVSESEEVKEKIADYWENFFNSKLQNNLN